MLALSRAAVSMPVPEIDSDNQSDGNFSRQTGSKQKSESQKAALWDLYTKYRGEQPGKAILNQVAPRLGLSVV